MVWPATSSSGPGRCRPWSTCAFGAATWAAFESHWWLVAAAAVAGGVGYAFGALRWWHAYRQDPAVHAGGASPRVLAVLAVTACLGLVVLLISG